jgi:hypothetical protein
MTLFSFQIWFGVWAGPLAVSRTNTETRSPVMLTSKIVQGSGW